MHGKFLFSSFEYSQLKEVEKVREKFKGIHQTFDVFYLYNYKNEPLPEPDVYTSKGEGINLSANYINKEIVEHCKSKGMKVGVWVRAKDFTESEDFYY